MCFSTNRPERGCGICVKLKSLLKQHVRSAHSTQSKIVKKHAPLRLRKLYSCFYCNKKFEKNSQRSRHLLTHQIENETPTRLPYPVKLERNDNGYSSKTAPTQSDETLTSFTAEDIDDQQLAAAAAGTNSLLEFSVITDDSGSKTFKCSNCEYVTKLKANIKRHITTVHLNLRLFSCKYCSKKFKSNKGLQLHNCKMAPPKREQPRGVLVAYSVVFTDENGTKGYKCNSCNYTANQKSNIRSHIETFHSNSKLFPCLLCSREFKRKSALRNHDCKMVVDKQDISDVSGDEKNETSDDEAPKQDIDQNSVVTAASLSAYSVVTRGENGSKGYNCDQCEYTTKLKANIQRHIKTVHLNLKPFLCLICSKRFKSKNALRIHRCTPSSNSLSVSNEEQESASQSQKSNGDFSSYYQVVQTDENTKPSYKCKFCEYAGEEKTEIHKHVEDSHYNVRPYSCELCSAAFRRKVALVKHIRKDHSNDSDNEEEQAAEEEEVEHSSNEMIRESNGAISIDNIQAHCTLVKSETGALNYKCKKCDYVSRLKYNLKRHIETVHLDLCLFHCNGCNRSFKSKKWLQKHNCPATEGTGEERENVEQSQAEPRERSTPKKMKIPSCEICNKQFKCMQIYRDHMNMHTGRRPYLCDFCGKAFTHKGYLASHHKLHTGEKHLQCSICNKRFSNTFVLRQHENMHNGIKPYSCEYCGRAFNNSANLKVHIRIHTGEKPYKCTLCEYRCSQSTSLKKHYVASHGNSYDFHCTMCEKKFKFKSHLTAHMLRHRGILRYFCEICNKGFTFAAGLVRHRKTHTNDRPFSCTFCAQAFYTKSHLAQHMKTHPSPTGMDTNISAVASFFAGETYTPL